MKTSYTATGGIMSVIAYFWYRYAVQHMNIFDVMNPDLLSRPQFLPMVLGILGVIVFLIGLAKD